MRGPPRGSSPAFVESAHPPRWKTLIAFAIIYFVWGSTFYAIRVGVHEVPPLLLAALRFTIAGAVLFAWAVARGERLPSRREWAATALVALLIFVVDYGFLFWAEQRVPSGTAAVILATIPAFMALAEITLLRTERLTFRLGSALLIGLAGVVVLVDPALGMAGTPVYTLGAVGLLVSAVSWSLASVLSKKLSMPSSKVMSAAAQMLVGGLLLCIVAAAAGEERGFHAGAVSSGAWIALAYLTVAGSLVGFTAYTWLIHHQSPTKVGTYAYVNPVVAVALGHFLGGEVLDSRTVAGTALVLLSVIVITTRRRTNAGAGSAASRVASDAPGQPDTQP
ncbi:MAG TPA: EamA family transporter [Steroidobacteraceae bacterium]|nr:EamA family transporter [Steroidobacteraceae bacterium]